MAVINPSVIIRNCGPGIGIIYLTVAVPIFSKRPLWLLHPKINNIKKDHAVEHSMHAVVRHIYFILAIYFSTSSEILSNTSSCSPNVSFINGCLGSFIA